MRYIKNILLVVLTFVPFLSVTAQNGPTVFVEPVINNIKVGPMTGNKNLSFGVRNIVEEIISDSDSLVLIGAQDKAEYTIKIELIFFDIVNTSRGISVFHKEINSTVIRMKGTLYRNGKKIKQTLAEGSSDEISTSTMIVDEGGGFNQQSASSALKKTTINLLEKLGL